MYDSLVELLEKGCEGVAEYESCGLFSHALLGVAAEHKPSELRAGINTGPDQFNLMGNLVIKTGQCFFCAGRGELIGEFTGFLNGSRYKRKQHVHRDPNPQCKTCDQNWPCKTAEIISRAVGVTL